MTQKFNNLYWRMKFGMEAALENFLKNEEGDSNMVAVIVLIFIVLAVAATFKDKLEEAVDVVMEKFMDFIKK